MDYIEKSQFDYFEATAGEDDEDIDAMFAHSEYVLKNLPYTMQIDENCFKHTFTNIYYWLLNQEEHPARQLDDLFFEEYVYSCAERAFQTIAHNNLIKQIKEKVKIIN
jgi:hypothetical protein